MVFSCFSGKEKVKLFVELDPLMKNLYSNDDEKAALINRLIAKIRSERRNKSENEQKGK